MFGLDKINKLEIKKRGPKKTRFPSLFTEERTIRESNGCRSERAVQDVFLFHKKHLFLPAGLFSYGGVNQGKIKLKIEFIIS
jgi:hypothetical protein